MGRKAAESAMKSAISFGLLARNPEKVLTGQGAVLRPRSPRAPVVGQGSWLHAAASSKGGAMAHVFFGYNSFFNRHPSSAALGLCSTPTRRPLTAVIPTHL